MYRILIEDNVKYDQLIFDQVREQLDKIEPGKVFSVERYDTLTLQWIQVSLSKFYSTIGV